MDPYIGKLLDNRYEILELVGTGGMAKVYKARCHRLNRLVAIKILREDLAQDAEFRRRFHDESQAIAMLSHPNIVAVYDVSRSSELEYIVMELIDGITLKQYMQRKGNKLNWREALHFIIQITKGLSHAHGRGIIHRDIKPHNIMVLRDGSVKVSDFGIARVASGGHSTLTQEALGSVHYISPEQARGSHIDSRSDLYSAGVVLYEMITGRLPFEGDTPVSVAIQHINSIPLSPRELDASIPEALEAITMKAMAPNPDDRYLSADDMLADLEEFRKNPNINFDYSASEFGPEEVPEEEYTQIRPAHSIPSRPIPERRYVEDDYEENYPPPHRRPSRRYEDEEDYPAQRRHRYEDEELVRRRGAIWPIFLAVAAVLLFVGVIVYFLWNTFFAGVLSPPNTHTVPNLVGEMYAEVKDDAALLDGFTLIEGDTVTNDAEPGTIIDQDPKGKREVGENVTEIKITISGGPDVVPMISLDGMNFQQASDALRAIGLKAAVPEYENHETIEPGYIISYTPQEGVKLAPGSSVEMVVSKGPADKPIPMPNLVGMTEELAKSTIEMYKLGTGKFDPQHDDTVPEGRVISQYPLAETEVTEGTEVNLIISLGPNDTKPPAVDPPAPPADGVTKDVDIPLHGYSGTVTIQLLMDGVQVASKTEDANLNESTTIPVTGTGTKVITYYINGVSAGFRTVNFDE